MKAAAVVGMGPIGHLHAAAYRDDARTELVAVCDIAAERAKRAAQQFGVRAYASVDEMLAAEPALDIVSVATAGYENGSDHYEPTMALIRAGVAVLGEKPISNSLEKAREMAQTAKELGVRYAIDFNHRFTPCVQQAKSWINEGRIGDVAIVQTRMWIDNSNESAPWFHLRSLHPHSFDLMRFFGGDIAEVGAFAAKGKGRSIWSNVEVIVRYETGAIGSLAGSYDAGPTWRRDFADILGSEGRIVIEDGYESVSLYRRDSSEVETYRNLGGMRTFPQTFPARIGRFIEQVESGADPSEIEGSGLDAVAAQAVIEASIKSASERCFVSVDSV